MLFVIGIIAIYFTVLWMGITEESRRSLSIAKSSASNDYFATIDVRVTSVNTSQGLLYERINLVPMGRFALYKTTPATDLKLFINSVSGRQVVLFPKGERIVPIEVTSLLSGNQNRYPFDHYSADIDLLVTAPEKKKVQSPPKQELDIANPLATTLVVGTSDFDRSEMIPINESFTATLPGFKFDGIVTKDDTYKLMHTAVTIRRANNVISVSLIVMTVMLVLAVSIMGMVHQVTASPGAVNLVPLTLCVALIFGLPALRNAQPSVPGMGVLSDYISFIWAELMVSISAIALAWIWIIRSMESRKVSPGRRSTDGR
ncbi:MAG TPA: DUF4436 family protein [Edaphobacter sp.]|nr:DUF4436 family protein [Edaphobacter sp.]